MNHFNKVQDFIDWLYTQNKFVKKASSDKMTYLMSLFNNPHKEHKFIHVGGTNGKGSTVSYLKNIYMNKGLKVGTFISPHIICFNERISINNIFISDFDVLRIANSIIDKFDLLDKEGYEHLTFFEFVTAIAFIYFGENKDIDLVIYEVGLGGRLDATNIVIPLVSIITNVSYDHMAQLGNNLENILQEKLGIVKNNIPLFTSIKDESLLKIIKKHCLDYNSELFINDKHSLKVIESSLEHNLFEYDNELIETSLIGQHQIDNAIIAYNVANYLSNLSSNFSISKELLYRSIKETTWPGRLEKVYDKPLIYLDGGHNIGCINELYKFINSLNIKGVRCVCAFSNDKEYSQMINLLDELSDEIIFTKYNYSRSADPKTLYDLSKSSNKLIIDNAYEALNYVYKNNYPFTIFIGSLYLISEVRNMIIGK